MRMLHPEEVGTAVNKVRKGVERERMLHRRRQEQLLIR